MVNLQSLVSRLRQSALLFSVLVLASAFSLTVLFGPESAYASQVTSRSIQMSSSTPGNAASYKVGFTTATTGSIQGVVVDFCSNDPLVGDSCTAPTGFTVTASPTVTGITGLSGTWTAGDLNSGRTLTLTNGSGGSVSSGTAVSFTITTVTNPTTSCSSTGACTFYARILTYSTTAGATGYVAGTEGAFTDYGGVSLSTVSALTITAKVFETLQFCVYIDGDTCGSAGSSALTLGQAFGSTFALTTSAVSTSLADWTVSTNAQGGAAVNLFGDTLKSGANSIAPVGSSSSAITAGTANFGLCFSSLGGSTTGSNSYPSCSGNTAYVFDNNGSTGTTSTYGEQVASVSGPVSSSTTKVQYAATVSNTTPAGVYTATHQYIATATF